MPKHQAPGCHHHGDDDKPITKKDLRELKHLIMSTIKDLDDAANTLSTSVNNLSDNVENLIEKIDEVVVALQGVNLPPEAEQALAALNASKQKAATVSGHVASESDKLDTVLSSSPASASKKKSTPKE